MTIWQLLVVLTQTRRTAMYGWNLAMARTPWANLGLVREHHRRTICYKEYRRIHGEG